MPILDAKKTRCPLCGAKNPIDAARCSICTRPLERNPLPTQAVYEEALWSTRIASKHSTRRRIDPVPVGFMLLVCAALLNYFVLGYGPSWAHVDPPPDKAGDWAVNRGQADYVADIPGVPMRAVVAAQGTSIETATVWVDSNWLRIRDDNTQSVGRLQEARDGAHAALVLGVGAAPADPAASLTAIVQAMLPGTELEVGGVSTQQDPPPGQQKISLVTNYTGFPEPADRGVVRATATVANGKIWIAASYVRPGDDPDLHHRLIEHFEPKLG